MTLINEPSASLDEAPAAVPHLEVAALLAAAGQRVAPVWPLSRFVAVNPYVGLADLPFEQAAERLAARAGIRSTLPLADYLEMVEDGRIGVADVQHALDQDPSTLIDGGASAPALLAQARTEVASGIDEAAAWQPTVPTVSTIASAVTGRDWDHLVVDRISSWAAAYFDEGQAAWRSADPTLPAYLAWKEEAEVDRTPEIAGLRGARTVVRQLPDDPIQLAALALGELGVPAEGAEAYVHALLLRIGGWAAHARRLGFEGELYGRPDHRLNDLAAIALAWELVLARTLASPELDAAWAVARAELATVDARPVRPEVHRRAVLQAAHDRAEQRALLAALAAATAEPPAEAATSADRPDVQAVFCIDVRSEVFRRHLEAVLPGAETVGFAGFFGMPAEVLPIAHGHGETQCPVLLTPGCAVPEQVGTPERTAEAAEVRVRAHQVQRAWKSFKMGAISCFSFVGPVGLAYLPKLFTDGAGRTRPVPHPDVEGLPAWAVEAKAPDVSVLPLDQRIALAKGALTAMSMREGLAPLVLIAGHGATTVNNPYDTGLDCGACGGHTGEANARIAAAILNDPEVRVGLAAEGIEVPADTWFLAAQHDTTTDQVQLFDPQLAPDVHRGTIDELVRALDEAGARARAERAPRLGLDPGLAPDQRDAAVLRRSTDWAQVRPEWGLAGCRAFVVAPRERTAGVDLGGRAFLHSYDWHQDEGFGVLELVMTAPMVVASWINLQYYGSTVDNERLGSGNKVLHNVVGRVGVVEGNGGDLRVGLPWQSVHDGVERQHDPLRLAVIIAAPTEAMEEVIARHEHVRHLLDHGWVHLYAMDDDGAVAKRYAGNLQWEAA